MHLEQLVRFISDDKPEAAVKLGNAIIEKVALLSQFPRMGKVFRQANRDALREVSIPPYRIFYEVNDNVKHIEILSIWHGSRQEPELK